MNHREIASPRQGRVPTKRVRNDNRGETLVEVLVSIAMLAILLVPSGDALRGSTFYTNLNRQELVGTALAEEAVATMDGIARTNILKFSPKTDVCWNAKPEHSVLTDEANPANNCENNTIAEGWYRLGVDMDNPLRPPVLESAGNDWDPNNPAENEEYRLKLLGDPAIYTHSDAGSFTFFYRAIRIQYADLKPPFNDNSRDAMRIEASVTFRVGREPRKITISTLIKPE